MRILISQSESETGEELNYELGESLPFTQILDKLQAWAESQGLFIIDYRVAAKPEAAEKTELTSDEIDVINLQLGDQLQLVAVPQCGLPGFIYGQVSSGQVSSSLPTCSIGGGGGRSRPIGWLS